MPKTGGRKILANTFNRERPRDNSLTAQRTLALLATGTGNSSFVHVAAVTYMIR